MARGTDTLWLILKADLTPLTTSQLVAQCDAARRSVEQRLSYWQRDGFVVRCEGWPPTYRMAENAPAAPPHYDRAGNRIAVAEPAVAPLWRAMRAVSKRGPFDAPMIAMIAGTTAPYALNYINRLRRAGYLRLLGNTPWRGEAASFHLVRDTGPIAPRIDVRPGSRVVIDSNTGKRFDISPGRVSLRRKPALIAADGGVG